MGKEEPKLKAKRHTPNQVIRKLREAELMLAEGKTIAEVAKALEVSEVTFHRWRNQYGGMKADDAKRLKELERENVSLKRLVADKELEILAHKEDIAGKLLSPARRRKAVLMLQDRLKLSERRACELAGQPRSTQRHEPKLSDDEERLRKRLRKISRAHPRWGYRRAHAQLLLEGFDHNRKRTQRIWREEGLRVPKKARNGVGSARRPRRPSGSTPAAPTTCGRSTSSTTPQPTAAS